MTDMSVAEIKKKFPEDWKKMQDSIKDPKPELPDKMFKQALAGYKELNAGILITYGPTKKHPFVAEVLLFWEDVEECYLDRINIKPRKNVVLHISPNKYYSEHDALSIDGETELSFQLI